MSEKEVMEYIERMDDLSTIPVVLARIIRTCNDPNSTQRDIFNLITFDPALSERVMRVANSAFFGHSGQVKNLYQAIMLLGIDRIKSLALGLTVLNAFSRRGASSATNIWIHSYEVAYVSSSLSKYLRLQSGDCFLAGLLHDVGRIVLLGMDAARFGQLTASGNLLEQELAVFGCTHPDAGVLLIGKLGMPRELMAPVQYHHAPLSAKDSQNMVAAVALAEALLGLRKSRPEEDGVWTKDHDALVKQFNLAENVLEGVYEDLINDREEIEGFFTTT